ncbi:hypothetical protein [Novosphingobium olei]|uniref:CD-NTase-associated protein 12/Pycsar effector protein TIR domain-containing protein n=1 Tax=Novosphingobium olei TaxID=2728851 RepID=A0A7Y0GB57_9SPHN|nr:hypothetical protein [Novosphingobium olei]NML95946.1 hypothetical protein [Novosphingobium olei]
MPQHIFFSWQSDVPNAAGRSLIERALERAIGRLQADAEVDPADRDLVIDRDTLDVPGSPPILDTIFAKIDRSTAFLSDLTFVAQRDNGSRCPNPNVCIEHGYALKALSWRRVIAVMNTAFGHPDQHELPFDLRHARRPILFDCPADADAETNRAARHGLTAAFVQALRAILTDQESRIVAAPAEPHPHDVELLARVRQLFDMPFQRFIRQQNFGEPFRQTNLNPMYEMNEDWVGAAFEFHDQPLQTAFAAVRAACSELGALVFERVHYMDRIPGMVWTKTDQDAAHGRQPESLQAVIELNRRGNVFADAIDAFERAARDRVRVAAGAVAAAPDDRPARAIEVLNALALDTQRGALPEIVSRPRMTMRLIPFAAIDGGRLDTTVVQRAQGRFPPTPHARVETDSDGRQWWSYGPRHRSAEGTNQETDWRMRLVRPGYLELQMSIGRRVDDDPDIPVDGRRLEGLVISSAERMAAIAIDLGLDGPALIHLGFDGIEDVYLMRPRGRARAMRIPELVLNPFTVQRLDRPLAEHFHESFDILWQTGGWPDGSTSYSAGIWAGYADRQNYADY